jgi:hypothetical protein
MGFWDSLSTRFALAISGRPAETPQPVLAMQPRAARGNPFSPVESIEKLHAEAGPIADAPPPTPGREYRIVDVPGSCWSRVNSDYLFADYIKRMPVGPVLVTLRFEPNDANKYAVSAYVNGRQVGWLYTEWTASDPQVMFMRRLDDAGILPRFKGIHRLTGNTRRHIINFDVAGRDDGQLDDVASRIIGQPRN